MKIHEDPSFQGFMKDPTQDRSAAVKALTESAGGKLESFAITRGQYDFCAVTSGDMPFENFAGVKLAVEASGTVENMVILEEMDMNKAAEHAANLNTEEWLIWEGVIKEIQRINVNPNLQ